MNTKIFRALPLLLLALSLPADAELRLAKLVGDGMVLQRDVEVPVWGWAESGEKVTVTFDGESYAATADETGKWTVRLPPREAGGPSGVGQICSVGLLL